MRRAAPIQFVIRELQDFFLVEPDGYLFPFGFNAVGMPLAILKFLLIGEKVT